MAAFEVSGGCLCGAIRYRVSAPAKIVEHCHCSMCRRAHGALHATGARVSKTDFHLTHGANDIGSWSSSPGNHRWFCRRCGSQIYMSAENLPRELYYWAASLDEGMHPGHPPEREQRVFVGSKAHWDRLDEPLPRHDAMAHGTEPDLDAS